MTRVLFYLIYFVTRKTVDRFICIKIYMITNDNFAILGGQSITNSSNDNNNSLNALINVLTSAAFIMSSIEKYIMLIAQMNLLCCITIIPGNKNREENKYIFNINDGIIV